jgi:activating signal cointegrator complex subunit 3
MIDVAAERGYLAVTLRIQQLMQCVVQARWHDEPVVMCLPHVNLTNHVVFEKVKLE